MEREFPLVALVLAPLLAFGPMVAYALLAWWFDRFEQEPLWLAGVAFIWGSVPTVILALCAQLPVAAVAGVALGQTAGNVFSTVLVAPLTEELFKGLFVLLLFLFYRREIDSLYDGFLYGSLVGFGFAATENVLYFLGAAAQGGLASMFGNFVARAILFGLNHAAFTALTGLGFAAARLSRSPLTKVGAPLLGLAAAVLFHALHNAVAVATELTGAAAVVLLWVPFDWVGVLLVFGMALFGLMRERRWIRAYLRDEVESGLLPESLYHQCGSLVGRTLAQWEALLRGDWKRFRQLGRLHRVAAELAFRKHQRSAVGEIRWEQEIQRLRDELGRLAGTAGES